jgi:CelD/BcsL family acetyltransferase involved in cellulose biosynthesis
MKRTAAAVEPPMRTPVGGAGALRAAGGDEIEISCYENDVPAFIEPELEQLYGSIYASLAQFRIYSDGADTSTYIARRGGQTVAIFLFCLRGNAVHVLNETFRVERSEVACFARHVFASYPEIAIIRFKAVDTDVDRLPYPFQRHNHVEDIVLALPPSAEAYFDMLGKGTRRNFKRHLRQLEERVPGWRYRLAVGRDIDEQAVRTIVELNRKRMAGKCKSSDIDDLETQRIIRLAKECGIVGVIEIDGRVCAGTIGFRAGDNYFLNVLAHDPAYDQYWLGILCCYHTICECIARGGREFHFLWGEYAYKYMLMGVKRDLDNLIVYRSRRHLLLNAEVAVRAWVAGSMRRLRTWLHAQSRSDTLVAKISLGILERMRSLRRR